MICYVCAIIKAIDGNPEPIQTEMHNTLIAARGIRIKKNKTFKLNRHTSQNINVLLISSGFTVA